MDVMTCLKIWRKPYPICWRMKKKSGIHFDLPRLKEKIRSYDVEMSDPSFWDNPDKAREISQKATEAKDTYDTYTRLFAQAEGIQELLDMAIEEDDESMEPEIKAEIDRMAVFWEKRK